MNFEIRGRVVNSTDGSGIAALRVEAWDKDVLVDDCLDSAETDFNGTFVIRFGEEAFRDAGLDRLPDVYFKVFSEGHLIASTEHSVICDLKQTQIEVTIEVTQPASPQPEPQRPNECLIEGLPRLTGDHPRIAILNRGTVLAIADGRSVSAFHIERREESAAATLRWRKELEAAIRHILPHSGGGLVALTESDGATTALVLDDDKNPRRIATFQGEVVSAAIAGVILVAAVRTPGGATLLEIDTSSGLTVSEQRLASSDVHIATSPSGSYISITDRATRTVEVRTPAGSVPCPPRSETEPHPPDTGTHDDPCHCKPQGDRPGDKGEHPTTHPPEGERRPEPCQPGDAAVPDDHGGTIVTDGGRIGRRPLPGTRESDPLSKDCWSDLFWTVDGLRWAGQYVVATQGNYTRRMAVLSGDDLRVVRERDFGNQGALVFSAPDTPDLIVFHRRRGAFELMGPVASVIDELDKGPIFFRPPEGKTFIGQKTMSLISEHAPTVGDIQALVLPVIDPGQAYNEPNLNKLGDFLNGGYFKRTKDYYEENSFRQAHLRFTMFGRDRGPGPGPMILPEPVANYFWPPFSPGGIELSRTLPVGPSTVSFDGGETLRLRAQTRTGARGAIDLTLRFAAVLLRAKHDAFPVKVIVGAAQTGTITARERDGTVRTLNLTFPPTTLEIKETDVKGGRDAIADYLQGVLTAAEAAAGVPAGPLFLKPEVRRVVADNLDFGELHVSLSFAPRPPGPGSLAVLSISATAALNGLGFHDTVRGNFNPATDTSLLQEYMTRLMRQAEADNTNTELNPVLAQSADVSLSGGVLKTTLLLSDNDGGPNASISMLSSSNTGQLFTSSAVLPGSISTKNDANAPRRLDELFNHAFAAAVERMRKGADFSPLTEINSIVLVGVVGSSAGAPPALAWNGTGAVGIGNLRPTHKSFTAVYDRDNLKVQLKSRWIVVFLTGTPDTDTLCHELGHALGFRDLYKQTDFRDDLRYLEDWALMDNESEFPHHAGYHKWQAGWIPEQRIVEVPKPDAGPTQAEALLVPVEFWDNGMEAAVRGVYAGVNVPVAQLMRMNLGGDGGMFDLVEARQATKNFSLHLPHSPALLVTNALVPWDDKQYGQIVGDEQRYRRELHLLNVGHELQTAGNEFDLGWPDELAAKGIEVRILDRKTVPRPEGNVEVFHVRVTREQAPSIDLGFTISDPYYKNPDLWLDHPDPGQTSPTIWPEGEPTHQGDKIHVPPAGRQQEPKTEKHWVVARVHNYGPVDALKVRVDFAICRPPGMGDRSHFVRFDTKTIPKIPAGAVIPVVAEWEVDANEKGHTCLRATIVDSEPPEDAGTGIVLASDNVRLANSEAMKNLDEHIPLNASPYEPVDFECSVNNEGHRPQIAYLQPEGLSEGMRLTISPPEQVVPPRSTVIFNCRLELDERVIQASCRSDSEFTILAWRMTEETSVRWGGVQYRVRPRRKTVTSVSGGWASKSVGVNGRVDPDPGGGEVRLRINFDNVPARWQAVPLGPGGTFQLALTPPAGALELHVEAVYRGSRYFGPSNSPPVTIRPYVVK